MADREQIARRVDGLEALVLDDGDVLHFLLPEWLTGAERAEVKSSVDAHWERLIAMHRDDS